MGGAVEDAEVFVALFDFGGEDFERFGVAVGDDDGGIHKARHRFVAAGEGLDEEEFGLIGIPRDEGGHEGEGGGFVFGIGVFGGFEGEAEEGFAAFFLELFIFREGEVGVDEVFGGVVDLSFLVGEFEEGGNHFVGGSEWGGVDFFSFGFQFLNFGEFVASDHFEKEAVIGSETGVEVGEVGFVGDVDSTEESDFDSVFFVKGEGGLEEDVFTGAIDADEVGGLFFGGKSFLGGGQEGEGGEGCEEEFHELRVS